MSTLVRAEWEEKAEAQQMSYESLAADTFAELQAKARCANGGSSSSTETTAVARRATNALPVCFSAWFQSPSQTLECEPDCKHAQPLTLHSMKSVLPAECTNQEYKEIAQQFKAKVQGQRMGSINLRPSGLLPQPICVSSDKESLH